MKRCVLIFIVSIFIFILAGVNEVLAEDMPDGLMDWQVMGVRQAKTPWIGREIYFFDVVDPGSLEDESARWGTVKTVLVLAGDAEYNNAVYNVLWVSKFYYFVGDSLGQGYIFGYLQGHYQEQPDDESLEPEEEMALRMRLWQKVKCFREVQGYGEGRLLHVKLKEYGTLQQEMNKLLLSKSHTKSY